MINIVAFLFLDDFIKLIVGSECLHTFPGWMIPFKASEKNIKPAHNSLHVWGGGGVRKVTILSSILGLGRMRWRHERAHKRPHRKSIAEPGLKLLTSLIPSSSPGTQEQNQQMSPSYPLSTPFHLQPSEGGACSFSEESMFYGRNGEGGHCFTGNRM